MTIPIPLMIRRLRRAAAEICGAGGGVGVGFGFAVSAVPHLGQ